LPSFRRTLQRKNMMAANYRHIGGLENRLGRHYSRFSASAPRRPLPFNHLPGENRGTTGRIGEVRLAAFLALPRAASITGAEYVIDGTTVPTV
jgi:hypothetical protein